MGARGLWLLLATAGMFGLLRGLTVQRIGGITGDSAGALVELTETALLVSLTESQTPPRPCHWGSPL